MKNYNFMAIFQNFNENFVKNVSSFWRKFVINLEVCIYRGFGGRSPPQLASLLKIVQKSNGNLIFFENFHKLSKKIWFVEANLNNNYSNFDGLLKIFSISMYNKLRNLAAKFCAFGLKTIRIWNFWGKSLSFTLEKLNGKLIFWPFSPIF